MHIKIIEEIKNDINCQYRAVYLSSEKKTVERSRENGQTPSCVIVNKNDEIFINCITKDGLKLKQDYLVDGIFSLYCINDKMPALLTTTDSKECNTHGFVECLFYSHTGEGKEIVGYARCLSGVYVNVFDPNPEHLLIEDIAHALSFMPRWGGHIKHWYSVADHCIAGCANFEDDKDKFDFLMHDASEGYLMDIVSPVKKILSGYYEVEDRLMTALSKKFGFQYPLTEKCKQMDSDMLKAEWYANVMMGYNAGTNPSTSEAEFLRLFHLYKPQ